MKANKSRVSLIAVILTMALMFSLFSLNVFAETDNGATEAPTETESAAEGTETKAEGTGTTAGTTAGTSTGTTASTSGTGSDKDDDLLGTIISLVILGVIVIAVAAFCIIKREKVGKFARSLKSEMGKIVWLPWDQVRKNTIVVIIVVVIVAVVIGLLDFAFSKGIIALGDIF